MQLVTGSVPIGDDFYAGRRIFVELLKETIIRQEVAIIGPRRTGKTSVIKRLFEEFESRSNAPIPIYINLESCSTPYDIITEIANKLMQQRTGIRLIFLTKLMLIIFKAA
jgi:Cdc6-like AAA superfamily ATPase